MQVQVLSMNIKMKSLKVCCWQRRCNKVVGVGIDQEEGDCITVLEQHTYTALPVINHDALMELLLFIPEFLWPHNASCIVRVELM